ncbi:4Fe-4S ferredoxin [Clostridium polyendosporum]|uniref:4Fe-4S ferredoxin n=1 Tax=Clostridium polyendosporum TaxID=69208 RepID=A0A919S2D4_9CLOT|nr:4Fe-4S binding protein [Clostridium polyendosporum]GIM29983.1 4Fe-4S ferredoxin [Clostridium polyendosporum]
MNKNKKIKFIRWGLLALFLILITIQGFLHQIKGGGEAASIHALCPYGALEGLYSLIGSGTFIEKIYSGTMVLFVLTIIIALIFRRSFCGLICPFGALQEFFALLGKKIFKKSFKIPRKIDIYLRYLKYLVLLITIFYAWKTAGLWMSPYDPWAAYAHLSEGISSLIDENLVGFILLIVTIIGSILYDRFFCKYLCPMGAVYGLISKFSPYKIVKNQEKCVNCNLCTKNCPMNIDVANSNQITSAECINCQLCVLSCPKDGCLENRQVTKSLKPALTITMVIVLFFSGILISESLGIYNTLPAPIPANQTITADEIKGYMTLKEVANGLKVDIKELYEKLDIPENVPEKTRFKDVKNFIPEFSSDEAKDILGKD